MSVWLIVLFPSLFGCFNPVLSSPQNDPYEVAGVHCAVNEEVSCMMVQCAAGRYCPAENYCYNPVCVCRFGYRKVRGTCVKKHPSPKLSADKLNSVLLQTYFG
ncbi:uncharacterized protein LOC115482823 [Drosophila hydei]|uniref:Uncharacterized protein LOC111592767 n=1 Tax=Drosophila hydei TaxID=7224 RepID=A0A6J1L3E9_DROHY|nr:uncharacterized protein LOC111592767 [Drosophila hydei]XP_030078856.1 uncharacterized protein LOC115482823 [Drosophila hydei]